MPRPTLRDVLKVTASTYSDAVNGVHCGGLSEVLSLCDTVDSVLSASSGYVEAPRSAQLCAGLVLCHVGATWQALNPNGQSRSLPLSTRVTDAGTCLTNTAIGGSGEVEMAKLRTYMQALNDPRTADLLPVSGVCLEMGERTRALTDDSSAKLLAAWLRMVAARKADR